MKVNWKWAALVKQHGRRYQAGDEVYGDEANKRKKKETHTDGEIFPAKIVWM